MFGRKRSWLQKKELLYAGYTAVLHQHDERHAIFSKTVEYRSISGSSTATGMSSEKSKKPSIGHGALVFVLSTSAGKTFQN